MVLAVVNIDRAVFSGISRKALARVVDKMVTTKSAVLARIELLRAKRNLDLAVFSHEPRLALALIRQHRIVAGGVVFALVIQAVVDVDLAAHARIPWCADAVESSFLEDFAGAGVAARVSVAGVYHVLTMLTVVAWCTPAGVLPLLLGLALCTVCTGECEAGVALGENFIVHLAFALEC